MMKSLCPSLLALALAACAPAAPEETVQGPSAAVPEAPAVPASAEAVAAGNADFALRLYGELRNEPGNLFLSPVSLAGAFGPVAAGARGETRTAIDAALGFPGGAGEGLHPALGGLLRGVEREREGVALSIANALWLKHDLPMKPEFLRTGQQEYGAQVERLDFRQSAASAKRINDWVSGETRGRIRELIAADSLDNDTALVVTNAVYFLADWADPFNASGTRDEPFYSPGGIRQIPLMSQGGHYRYFETDGFQAIDLPYKDPSLSMTVLLPKARGGLPSLEASLTGAKLREWLARIDAENPRKVYLHLPKLKMEESYNLVDPLRALGMGIAFTNRADFRGIAEADLLISQVVQKTFVRIDEKGTEAAAATGVEVELTSAPPAPPPTFRADHPFFFVLRDKQSGAILFLGRVVAPERP